MTLPQIWDAERNGAPDILIWFNLTHLYLPYLTSEPEDEDDDLILDSEDDEEMADDELDEDDDILHDGDEDIESPEFIHESLLSEDPSDITTIKSLDLDEDDLYDFSNDADDNYEEFYNDEPFLVITPQSSFLIFLWLRLFHTVRLLKL